jgi:thiamine biosynthesis lipoprotein
MTLACQRAAEADPTQREGSSHRVADETHAGEGKSEQKGETARAAAPVEPIIHRHERKLMGTIWAVMIAGGEANAARAAADAAFDEVARLEDLLSEWRAESEISRVNQQAGKTPQSVGPELMVCLDASLEVARWSHGAFDISWAALRDLWDFSADSKHIPPSIEAVKARLPLWNYRLIEVNHPQKTAFLRKKGMAIGLGGVAKGYALDRMGEVLRARSFGNFIIFAGGQLLIGGTKGGRLWRVGIQHPRTQGYFGFVEATDCSVSTSGDYEHSFEHQGRRYHHILDPKTGFPSDKSSSVTVIAPTALWADAVDTALFIMGPEEALKALPKAPGGPIEAVLVGPDLKLSVSPGAKERLLMRYTVDDQGRLDHVLPPNVPPQPFR